MGVNHAIAKRSLKPPSLKVPSLKPPSLKPLSLKPPSLKPPSLKPSIRKLSGTVTPISPLRSSYVPRASGEYDCERPAPHRALAPYLLRTTLWRSQLLAVSFQPEPRLDQDDAPVSISPSQSHR